MIELEENNIYFYLDKSKLIENINEYSELGNIYYPLKTNTNINLIRNLQPLVEKRDSGFLISSINHFEILKKLNINTSKMCFINVLAEDNTIKYLYDNGIRFFTFDNIYSVMNFEKYADLSKVKIAVRLSTIQIFNNKFTHLGANLEDTLKILKFLKDNNCNDYGISFYIQNNLKKENGVLEKILEFIQKKYKNLGIDFVNIGGIDKAEKINRIILEDLKKELGIKQINLEVGKYLVENTVELETKIIREKLVNNIKTVIIKNGIYSGFFDILLYDKKFSMYLKNKQDEEIKIKFEKTEDEDSEFMICGGSSDSGDKIGVAYINSKYKNELKVGAKILIKDVGAYFEEFFMPYSSDLKKVYIEV